MPPDQASRDMSTATTNETSPSYEAAPADRSGASGRVERTVRQQYEALPYPPRDPADEKHRLLYTSLDDLSVVSHHAFAGRLDLTRPTRILVAGGGTGDAIVYLAHQLRHAPAELYYLDLSMASLEIAKTRVATRGLAHRVRWIQGSLLDLPVMGLPPCDYINCSGVLHHLADPVAGLRALTTALKPEGCLGIMVYGQIGRTAIYQMQSLLRLMLNGQPATPETIASCRQLLQALPPTSWYARARELFDQLDTMSDTEFYDLFLHSQDRAYTVPQLHEWLGAAGLQLVNFTLENRLFYDLDVAFTDPVQRAQVAALPRQSQQAVCELWWGILNKHAFWASRRGPQPATVQDRENIPVFTDMAKLHGLVESLRSIRDDNWKFALHRPNSVSFELQIQADPIATAFLNEIDGRKSLARILQRLGEQFPQIGAEAIQKKVDVVFTTLHSQDVLVLRHSSTQPLVG